MSAKRRFLLSFAASALIALPAAVQAQGRGIGHMPSLPTTGITPPGLSRLPDAALEHGVRGLERASEATERLAGDDGDAARHQLVDKLLSREHRTLERDPAGEPIVRGEVVLDSPSVATLDAAQAAGFRLLRDQRLPSLGLYVVVLQAPPGLSTAEALQKLRAADGKAAEDFNHLYLPAGSVGGTPSSAAAAMPRAPAGVRDAAPAIGLVDGGVDTRHPSLRQAQVRQRGCGESDAVPEAHGTAVASLLVGEDRHFKGAAPGATLVSADLYCGSLAHGTAEHVVEALAWLAEQRVGVINLSLVGPPNGLLERAIQALQARGHLIVAAVGNDGPAAPPLYPAAYPGVIGVTGVDARDRVLPEAAQGPQVAFAAPGAEVAVARVERNGYTDARGTSFAAPIVAGLLARQLPAPDPRRAALARATLARSAVDLGAPGRDPVYGDGLVGRELRVRVADAEQR
jgi:subtilisin family serine protease